MACSSLAELVADLKALRVDLSGPSADFAASRKPPADMIDRRYLVELEKSGVFDK